MCREYKAVTVAFEASIFFFGPGGSRGRFKKVIQQLGQLSLIPRCFLEIYTLHIRSAAAVFYFYARLKDITSFRTPRSGSTLASGVGSGVKVSARF